MMERRRDGPRQVKDVAGVETPFVKEFFPALTAKSPSPLNLGDLHPGGHGGIRRNILFSHRTLQEEIIDVECKGLCQVRFGNTFSRTFPRLIASSAQLCSGKSCLEFCGKEVT